MQITSTLKNRLQILKITEKNKAVSLTNLFPGDVEVAILENYELKLAENLFS